MIVEVKSILEKIQEYVEWNVVPASQGRKCVDGRYLPTQASGMIARPGGDMGYVMALLAVNKRKNLGLTSEECFDEVYKVVSRGKEHFYMHTDHHADPDMTDAEIHHQTQRALIGCGHVVKAALEILSKEYDLDGDDVERVVEYARKIAQTTPSIEIVNLEGDHGETGVLVINSEQFSINSQDPISGKMYFIYDAARDMRFLRKMVLEMAIPRVDFEEMKKESDLQLQATLHNLVKGLSIYDVNFQGRIPIVCFSSFVE